MYCNPIFFFFYSVISLVFLSFIYAYLPTMSFDEAQLRKNGLSSEEFEDAAATRKRDEQPEASTPPGDEPMPVQQHRTELMSLINSNNVLIVCGETGSGKSTQIPQFLIEAGLVSSSKKMAIAQPRRLAASSLASRVAREMQTQLGSKVGYSVRFENRTSRETVLKYITNGMLIREILADPRLEQYGAIMIDEAHERTLETDIILGLVAHILSLRNDLKVIVSSATMDSVKLAEYFGGAPIYHVPGRRFPVTTLYRTHGMSLSLVESRELVVETILKIHTDWPLDGDVLAFLPGQADIETVEEKLSERSTELASQAAELIIVPVFANLANDQQSKIFQRAPANARRVILATNIAETSLTIPHVKYVVDPGLVKQQKFNAKSAMDTLEIVRISQASAAQRAGRAGRTGPGICYRLYSKHEFNEKFAVHSEPEILRANLSQVCLLLLSLGVEDVASFPWVETPDSNSVVGAFQLLYALGAVSKEAKLTKVGRILAELPVDPKLGKTLLASHALDCVEDVAIAAAMLDELSSLYIQPKRIKEQAKAAHEQLRVSGGDHLTLVSIYKTWRQVNFSSKWCRDHFLNVNALRKARNVKHQLTSLCERIMPILHQEHPSLSCGSSDSLVLAFAHGYFVQTARLSRGHQGYVGYYLGTPILVHPSSTIWPLKPLPPCILYHELVLTSQTYARGCLELPQEVLRKVAPHFQAGKLANRA